MAIPSLSTSTFSAFAERRAKPISCTPVRNRLVKREEASMKSGSRSVKTLREQLGLRQKNLRTVNTKRMGRPMQGRSRGWRKSRTVDGRGRRRTLRAGPTGAV